MRANGRERGANGFPEKAFSPSVLAWRKGESEPVNGRFAVYPPKKFNEINGRTANAANLYRRRRSFAPPCQFTGGFAATVKVPSNSSSEKQSADNSSLGGFCQIESF